MFVAETATANITDEATTDIDATVLSAIGAKTSGAITVTNAIDIAGTADEVTAALVTDDTLVVASTATVTISDNPSISALNAIAAKTGGVVTATLAADSLSNLGALTTAGTDVITITVNDNAEADVTASNLSTLGGKTAGVVTVSNAVDISGTASELTAALVTADTLVVAGTATANILSLIHI